MADVKDEELLPFGWAPGGYSILCSKCPGGRAPMDRWGTKRSWRCREHAVEDLMETRRRVREVTTPKTDSAPAAPETQAKVDGSLEEHCRKFIKDQRITCAETIAQTDRVIENAYDFIEGICELVGYHQDEE